MTGAAVLVVVGMTSDTADGTDPDLHAREQLAQRQAEADFIARKSLQLEIILAKAAQPLVILSPKRPNLILRAIARLWPRLGLAQSVAALRQTALFDPVWYLARYPDVAQAGADPVRHYLEWGADEQRDPSRHFCTAKYARLYPDVIEAGLNPLLHYLRSGSSEGRRIYPAPSVPAPPKPSKSRLQTGDRP